MSRPVCVLVGPPGAGKSTVGALVAADLGLPFADVDALIEEAAGKPIPDIFVDDGEDHFRALERAGVSYALAERSGVLALGGGAVMAEETRALLMDQVVVFLSVELADAIRRVGLGAGRPLLAVNPRATMRHMLEQRRPYYEEVADVIVPTDGRTAREVADAVLAALRDPELAALEAGR